MLNTDANRYRVSGSRCGLILSNTAAKPREQVGKGDHSDSAR